MRGIRCWGGVRSNFFHHCHLKKFFKLKQLTFATSTNNLRKFATRILALDLGQQVVYNQIVLCTAALIQSQLKICLGTPILEALKFFKDISSEFLRKNQRFCNTILQH